MTISIIRAICAAGVAAAVAACGDNRTASGSSDGVSALEHEVSQLETQAVRLEDVRDVERLQRAYGYYLDAAQWDQIADLFADDGSIEIGLDGLYKGKERVRQ